MEISAIALQGLQAADQQLDKAAASIASAASLSPDTAPADAVDLSAEMIALLAAKNAFAANLATLKVADDVQKSAIDLIA